MRTQTYLNTFNSPEGIFIAINNYIEYDKELSDDINHINMH